MKEQFEKISKWLKKNEQTVLDTFAELPSAINFGDRETRCVYVPGTRNDRVLLLAHADTVFLDHPKITPIFDHGLIRSGYGIRKLGRDENGEVTQILKGGLGIGADDRAGCAAIWELKELGHSILITNCEEDGCIGSSAIASNDCGLLDELQKHQFMVQFDRNGFQDLVFYDVGTEAFIKYCQKKTGYQESPGSFTDIRVLCRDICGVNISIGYKNEHSHNEFLSIKWWQRTVDITRKWLSGELPKFKLI